MEVHDAAEVPRGFRRGLVAVPGTCPRLPGVPHFVPLLALNGLVFLANRSGLADFIDRRECRDGRRPPTSRHNSRGLVVAFSLNFLPAVPDFAREMTRSNWKC